MSGTLKVLAIDGWSGTRTFEDISVVTYADHKCIERSGEEAEKGK